MCDDPECDYDMFRDLAEHSMPDEEHPLDRALRTNDIALRCFYWEHGNADEWESLSGSERESYRRPPTLPEHRLPKGTYYMYGASGCLRPLSKKEADDNWNYAFCAA